MRAAADRNKRAVREQENRLAGLWGDSPAAPGPGAAQQQQQAAQQGPRVRGSPDPDQSPAQWWSDPAPQAAARVSPRGGEAGARTPGEPTAEERWGPRVWGEEARERWQATPLELHVNDSWLSQGGCALATVSSCKANSAPLTKGERGACCSCQQR